MFVGLLSCVLWVCFSVLGNEFEDKEAIALARVLEGGGCPQLTTLNLESMYAGLWALWRVCVVVVCDIDRVCGFVFRLLDNRIGVEGATALARAMEGGGCTQLKTLNLGGMYAGLCV